MQVARLSECGACKLQCLSYWPTAMYVEHESLWSRYRDIETSDFVPVGSCVPTGSGVKCNSLWRCDRASVFTLTINRLVACVRELAVFAGAITFGSNTDATGPGNRLYKVAVTSMHICTRIFAWAWDLLVGSAAYPMPQVSSLSFKLSNVSYAAGNSTRDARSCKDAFARYNDFAAFKVLCLRRLLLS